MRVLVVGGGPVAARKTAAFAHGGAHVRVVAPRVTDAIEELARSARVDWLAREYAAGDIADAQLVIAATDDRGVNAQVAADARAANRLVNVADQPDEGNFSTMAVHRSGPLVIGVSAGGVPGAAARIRDAIARRFDGRYARALEQLAELRRRALVRGDAAGWRAMARVVVDGEFCRAVEDDALDARISTWR